MKTIHRTFNPDTLELGGKKYIQDHAFNEYSKVKVEHIDMCKNCFNRFYIVLYAFILCVETL